MREIPPIDTWKCSGNDTEYTWHAATTKTKKRPSHVSLSTYIYPHWPPGISEIEVSRNLGKYINWLPLALKSGLIC